MQSPVVTGAPCGSRDLRRWWSGPIQPPPREAAPGPVVLIACRPAATATAPSLPGQAGPPALSAVGGWFCVPQGSLRPPGPLDGLPWGANGSALLDSRRKKPRRCGGAPPPPPPLSVRELVNSEEKWDSRKRRIFTGAIGDGPAAHCHASDAPRLAPARLVGTRLAGALGGGGLCCGGGRARGDAALLFLFVTHFPRPTYTARQCMGQATVQRCLLHHQQASAAAACRSPCFSGLHTGVLKHASTTQCARGPHWLDHKTGAWPPNGAADPKSGVASLHVGAWPPFVSLGGETVIGGYRTR